MGGVVGFLLLVGVAAALVHLGGVLAGGLHLLHDGAQHVGGDALAIVHGQELLQAAVAVLLRVGLQRADLGLDVVQRLLGQAVAAALGVLTQGGDLLHVLLGQLQHVVGPGLLLVVHLLVQGHAAVQAGEHLHIAVHIRVGTEEALDVGAVVAVVAVVCAAVEHVRLRGGVAGAADLDGGQGPLEQVGVDDQRGGQQHGHHHDHKDRLAFEAAAGLSLFVHLLLPPGLLLGAGVLFVG